MKLIVGLGNPGKKYQNTRHNVGQMTIDALEQKYGFHLSPSVKFDARVGESSKNLFVTLNSYMNLSGPSVQKFLNFYKISASNLFVIHDDLDLEVGEYRVQFDRGAAGHNGIKSIIETLNTQAFYRIRIGIDHPRNTSNPHIPVEDYVLQTFSPDEKVLISKTIDKIVTDFDSIIGGH